MSIRRTSYFVPCYSARQSTAAKCYLLITASSSRITSLKLKANNPSARLGYLSFNNSRKENLSLFFWPPNWPLSKPSSSPARQAAPSPSYLQHSGPALLHPYFFLCIGSRDKAGATLTTVYCTHHFHPAFLQCPTSFLGCKCCSLTLAVVLFFFTFAFCSSSISPCNLFPGMFR